MFLANAGITFWFYATIANQEQFHVWKVCCRLKTVENEMLYRYFQTFRNRCLIGKLVGKLSEHCLKTWRLKHRWQNKNRFEAPWQMPLRQDSAFIQEDSTARLLLWQTVSNFDDFWAKEEQEKNSMKWPYSTDGREMPAWSHRWINENSENEKLVKLHLLLIKDVPWMFG